LKLLLFLVKTSISRNTSTSNVSVTGPMRVGPTKPRNLSNTSWAQARTADDTIFATTTGDRQTNG